MTEDAPGHARGGHEPLAGLRVLELSTGIAAAWCGRQFAAWGADVVAIEPPGGAAIRRAAPMHRIGRGRSTSLLYEYVAAGKRSTIVDLTSGGSLQTLIRLALDADVIVSDLPAGEALDLHGALPPGVVHVSITPFGLSGPYALFQGTDLIVQALSGYAWLNGDRGAAPLAAPGNLLSYASGVSAFVGALGALHERDGSGAGQLVEVSMLEAVGSIMPYLRDQYTGRPDKRRGGPSTGIRLVECADGYVSLAPFLNWDRIIDALLLCDADVPVEQREPREDRDLEAALRMIESYTKDIERDELIKALWTADERGTLYDRQYSPFDLPAHPQLTARHFFHNLQHPELGALPFAGSPAVLSHTPMARASVAPARPEVDAAWKPPTAAGRASRPRGTETAHAAPLAGVRILDLTQAWVGPYASLLLADLGAEVVKVESHKRPDVWRFWKAREPEGRASNPNAHPGNVNTNFNSVNRNKRSLALDLKTERGRALLLDLVSRCDVLMENYTSGTMAELGLTDEILRGANPDLVIVSFSGYGRTGPYAGVQANGMTIECVSGWTSLHGYVGGRPQHTGFYQADAITGLQMAATTLLALRVRRNGGPAQTVDGSMHEAACGYMGEQILHAALGGDPGPAGSRHPQQAPHGIFRCRGADEWVAIAVRDDSDWEALIGVAPELDDLRFGTAAGRLIYIDAVEDGISRWTAGRSALSVMQDLQAAGVPAGVVRPTHEVRGDPHVEAREWFVPMTHPDMGTHLYNGRPWRFSRSPLPVRNPSPRLGEHSAELLGELLGLQAAEVADLFEQDVTGTILERTAGEDTDELQRDPV